MHQHPSASLRSVVLMAPPSFQPWLIPTTIPSGIPASASESRICPTLTGQYRYGPVTQPHECDAHIPPLPPCHPRHAGQWSYLHRQQDPETGTPRSSVGPPRFHAPRHGPSPAIRGLPVTPNHIHPQQIIQPSAVNPHRHHISTTQDIVQADTTALLFPEISPAQRSERRARPISTLACFDMNPGMSLHRLPGLYGTPGTERPHPLNSRDSD